MLQVPAEMVYAWNPWLFGTVIHSMEWFEVPQEHAAAVIGAQMCVWQMDANTTLCMLSSRLPASRTQIDLGCAPYVLYGVKYIGLVSLPVGHKLTWVVRALFCMVLNILNQFPCQSDTH